jgi:hypothetical protein
MKAIRIPYISAARFVLLCALTTMIGCALVACAAPPPWTAPTPPLPVKSFYWDAPTNATAATPFWYVYFTNDVLVFTVPQTVQTNAVQLNYGQTEHAVAASNAAGRSACATYTTNIPLPVVVSQPSTIHVSK